MSGGSVSTCATIVRAPANGAYKLPCRFPLDRLTACPSDRFRHVGEHGCAAMMTRRAARSSPKISHRECAFPHSERARDCRPRHETMADAVRTPYDQYSVRSVLGSDRYSFRRSVLRPDLGGAYRWGQPDAMAVLQGVIGAALHVEGGLSGRSPSRVTGRPGRPDVPIIGSSRSDPRSTSAEIRQAVKLVKRSKKRLFG